MNKATNFRSEPTVELVDWMPRVEVPPEQRIAAAARVSSGTEVLAADAARNAGLLRMLMRDSHSSPFEHVVFTWRIETPIFVAREIMRHRWSSFNETSGRYREMEPTFYIPGKDRPMVQIGKPGAYRFEPGTEEQHHHAIMAHKDIAMWAWGQYKRMLREGIAREVARNVLPLSLFTSLYATMNLRSFSNFASLRWAHPDAQTPTFPLYEIEQVAKLMEGQVQERLPQVWENFNSNGRRPI